MSQAVRSALHVTWENAVTLDAETRPKFFAMKHIFWIKLSDFMDIVPRHQHLSGLPLLTRQMLLHEFPFGRGGTADKPVTSDRHGRNGGEVLTNGDILSNGYR